MRRKLAQKWGDMLKRKILYLVALISVLAVNILYVEYAPFILLIIMISFPIVSRGLLQIQSNQLGIEISMQETIVSQGDIIKIKTRIHNSFAFPSPNIVMRIQMNYLNYDEDNTHTINFDVRGKSILEFDTNLTMNYCGTVYLYLEPVRIFDYVSLFKVKIDSSYNSSIIVMPKLYEPTNDKERANTAHLSESDEYSQDKSGDDASEIFDLREYADGDNLSRVHWKLSSKGENLIVKEYSLPLSRTEVILVELLPTSAIEGGKNIDFIYQAVYALGNYLWHHEITFKLAYYDKSSSRLKIITIDSFEKLQSVIIEIIGMKLYEEPYAWNNFWASEISEDARVHYIRCKANEKSEYMDAKICKNGEHLDENNIILADENNIQEIVDSFYLKI